MDSKDMQTIGLGTLGIGIIMLLLSAYGAYTFPSSYAPPNTDLVTLLTIAWQRTVLIISLAIAGIIEILTGTMLYGFGRIEEAMYLRLLEDAEKKGSPP